MRVHGVTFSMAPAMTRYGEIIQRQHFCHYGDTVRHTRRGYVTAKLHVNTFPTVAVFRPR